MRMLNINIIVILIFGILTAATPPDMERGHRFLEARSQIHLLNNVVKIYENGSGRTPTELEGLNKLVEEKYIEFLPRDPWGNSYIYKPKYNGKFQFYIYSVGPNGIDDNEELDDITSSEKKYRCELYSSCPTIKDDLNMVFSTIFLLSLGSILIQGLCAIYKRYIRR